MQTMQPSQNIQDTQTSKNIKVVKQIVALLALQNIEITCSTMQEELGFTAEQVENIKKKQLEALRLLDVMPDAEYEKTLKMVVLELCEVE